MNDTKKSNRTLDKTILIAYDLNPKLGSESGAANNWLSIISRQYQVEVFVDSKHKEDIDESDYPNAIFNFVDVNNPLAKLFKNLKLYNLSYNIFIGKTKPIINDLIAKEKIKLIHCLTPAGIHSYNDLFKFGLPIIIGPLGGGLRIQGDFKKISRQNWRSRMREVYYDLIIKHPSWKRYFSNATKIIVGTENVKEILPANTLDKTQVIFDTSVDTDFFKPNHANKKAKDKTNQNTKDTQHKTEYKTKGKTKNTQAVSIAFIGRLEPEKGCEILLDSFYAIAGRHGNAHLHFAGVGSLLPHLMKKTARMKLDPQVTFHKKLNRKGVLDLLNKSDIFCLPSLREPGGTCVLEAMSCGLPVIVTNYGGPSYSVTDEVGIKIAPKNYSDYVSRLADSLGILIDNEKLRRNLGGNARRRIISEFSREVAGKKMLSVYSEVIGR